MPALPQQDPPTKPKRSRKKPTNEIPHEPAPVNVDPNTIKDALDKKVIGQDEPKHQISSLISLHLSWFASQNRLHPSPNAVIIGPTGVGKTHTVRTACESLRIPFTTVDATSLVPSGIVGRQVEDILADLVQSSLG